LTLIRGAAERAADLTRQLLLFSRKQVMQPRDLDVNELITGLVKMLQRIIGEDVRLELSLHPRPLTVRADAGMLDQVLMNLVVNARDAMPAGGKLSITTAEKDFSPQEAAAMPEASSGRYAWLCVTDTGCGIPPEIVQRIFEPFFTTKDPGKGTGLGLATVFGIVKQHRGMILVESEVGRGTTFRVFLPAAGPVGQPLTDPAAKRKPPGGTETVLLAEDDPFVRRITRAVLEQAGYTVLEAADGAEALRLWSKDAPGIQLLLTDIVMPGNVKGRDLAARLRSTRPQLPILFMSGYSSDLAGQELALLQGQNFLQKPFQPAPLLEAVRRSLDS
jgi:CheY-like chemotaxis protein